MYVITRKWSRWNDSASGVQMNPVCVTDPKDASFGCYIAASPITADEKKKFSLTDGFEFISDGAYTALTTLPVIPPVPESEADDPLSEEARKANAMRANLADGPPPQKSDEPPAPPPSK